MNTTINMCIIDYYVRSENGYRKSSLVKCITAPFYSLTQSRNGMESSWSDDSIPAPEPSLSDLQQKSHVSPADAFCATAVSTDGLVPCNPILLPVLSTGSPSAHHSPCAEVTAEVMVSDAEPSPGCADSTDLDPVCMEIEDVSETPPKKKRSKGKNRPKSRLKRKFHLTYQNTLRPAALTSMSVAALLSAKLPTTQTWFAVHCAWRGITSSVPAKILINRVSGAATRVAYCPPPSKTLWHKLRACFRVSNQLRLPSRPRYSSWKPRMVIYGLN